MEIIPVTPRGFCKGVVNAIAIAKATSLQYPNQNIYMLGMIVHNAYVVEALKQFHIIPLESKSKTRLALLDEISEGVVIFTAHGVSDAVREKAIAKGLIYIDASCSDVIDTQNLVKQKIQEGYAVLYIGLAGHPEAEAIIELNPQKIYLLNSFSQIKTLPPHSGKLFVTNQTTMNIQEIKSIQEALKQKFPQIEIADEICNATRIRQEAILKLQNIDLLYVVGDPKSNNANKLKLIALEHGIKKVFLIESAQEINLNDCAHAQRIAVTSGASTPTFLTQQVITFLTDYALDSTTPIPDFKLNQII